jgi:divalent metal cation (Fe/Co/Zn/Cd) transporter
MTTAALTRRGLRLAWFGLAWNVVEAVVSLAAGIAAGSVSLVGFGVDAAIECAAGVVALWRLRVGPGVEHVARRLVGASFCLLAAYVAWEAVESLVERRAPDASPVGIAIAAASLLVMPLLARAKRRVAAGLASGALASEARQTSLCAWLSAILLAGLALNALLGWWWADAAAALMMVPIIVREGWEGLQGRDPCGCGDGGCGTA